MGKYTIHGSYGIDGLPINTLWKNCALRRGASASLARREPAGPGRGGSPHLLVAGCHGHRQTGRGRAGATGRTGDRSWPLDLGIFEWKYLERCRHHVEIRQEICRNMYWKRKQLGVYGSTKTLDIYFENKQLGVHQRKMEWIKLQKLEWNNWDTDNASSKNSRVHQWRCGWT